MPSLKDLKVRINSVKSTQKITSAMKMVAAAKLRRAQEGAEAARPFAQRMERMLGSLAVSVAGNEGAPAMLTGTGADQTHLIDAESARFFFHTELYYAATLQEIEEQLKLLDALLRRPDISILLESEIPSALDK